MPEHIWNFDYLIDVINYMTTVSFSRRELLRTMSEERDEDEAERAHFMEVLRAFVDYEPYMFNDTLRRKRHLGRLPLKLQNRMPGGKTGNDAALSNMLSCSRANAAFLNRIAGNMNFYHNNFNTHPSEW